MLLTYLAAEGPTSRERLAGLSWPERPQARARANLRRALLRLRRTLPLADGDPVSLAAGRRGAPPKRPASGCAVGVCGPKPHPWTP